MRLLPRLDESCLMIWRLPGLLVQALDGWPPCRHSRLILLLLSIVRALSTWLVFVLRLMLVVNLNVLERRIRLHLVVVGLLHGHCNLLRILLLRLLNAVVVHVYAEVLTLSICVDHELDGRDGLLLILNLGRTGSLVAELLFRMVLVL